MSIDDDIKSKAKAVEDEAFKQYMREVQAGCDRDGRRIQQPPMGTAFTDWAKGQENMFAWIPSEYSRFCDLPKPEDFDPIIKNLESVNQRFMNPDTTIDTVRNQLSDWRGDGKKSFDDFLNYMDKVPGNQQALVKALKHVTEANRDVYVRTRESLLKLAEETRDKLAKMGDSDPAGRTVALTILVGLATAGVSAATGGVGAAVAWTVVSGFITGVNAGIPTVSLAGKSVTTILNNMSEAMRKIQSEMFAKEDEIIKSIQETNAMATGTGGKTKKDWFVMPRPAVADRKPGDKNVFKKPVRFE